MVNHGLDTLCCDDIQAGGDAAKGLANAAQSGFQYAQQVFTFGSCVISPCDSVTCCSAVT